MSKTKPSDCEIILIDEQKKPQRILKKQQSSIGTVKYLVQYAEDQQWETDKLMKEKHPELIEDYNFFSVSGERYDESMLAQKREQFFKLQNYELPQVAEENFPKFRKINKKIISAQDQKREKIVEKIQKNATKEIEIEQEQQEQQQQQPILIDTITEKILEKHLINPLIEQSFQECQKAMQQKAILGDTIKSISVNTFKDEYLFQVEWNVREDGIQPLSEYYQYAQLKAMAPMLLLQFYENQILDAKDISIKFDCMGDLQSKISLLKSMIQRNNSGKSLNEGPATPGKQLSIHNASTIIDEPEQQKKKVVDYEKELEEAYSEDGEIPKFQFHQSEF